MVPLDKMQTALDQRATLANVQCWPGTRGTGFNCCTHFGAENQRRATYIWSHDGYAAWVRFQHSTWVPPAACTMDPSPPS